MQETLDHNRGLDFRWLAGMGWCLLGIFTAVVAGALVGWFESLFDTWFVKLLIIYLIVLAVACWLMISFFLTRARGRCSPRTCCTPKLAACSIPTS